MSHYELEGRFFGSSMEMKIDRDLFNMSGGVYNEKTDTWTSAAGVRKVSWIYIRDRMDVVKVSGIEFQKVMFDLSMDRESVMYILTRVRGRR